MNPKLFQAGNLNLASCYNWNYWSVYLAILLFTFNLFHHKTVIIWTNINSFVDEIILNIPNYDTIRLSGYFVYFFYGYLVNFVVNLGKNN